MRGSPLIFLSVLLFLLVVPSFGKLPIQASWFRDRYTAREWDDTLDHFHRTIGGRILVQRGTQLQDRSKADIEQDYNTWVWCGTAPGGVGGESCITATEKRAQAMGLEVIRYLTYVYEEDYSDKAMLRCPQLDGKTNSSRIYYQMVLPTTESTLSDPNDPCSFVPGSKVAIVLTAFAGTDSHKLLLERAASFKDADMSVFMGLPQITSGSTWDPVILPAYMALVERIIDDHAIRYDGEWFSKSFAGYYATDETDIGNPDSNLLAIYQMMSENAHKNGRQLLLSPWLDSNLSQLNSSLADHMAGWDAVAATKPDFVAIQEGRGTAKGSYWWKHERFSEIRQVDPSLLKIDQYLDPTVPNNQVYQRQYTFPNRALFEAMAARVDANKGDPTYPRLWLNVEAFEYLRTNPCLPVDVRGSGMAELLDRTTKERVDRAFTQQSAFVSGIISFAYDSDYLCVPSGFNSSLADEIEADGWRPVVSLVSINSDNTQLSVVGLNLKDVASFHISFLDKHENWQQMETTPLSFNPNWGTDNARLPELQEVMIAFPEWSSVQNPSSPLLSVQAKDSNWPCFWD